MPLGLGAFITCLVNSDGEKKYKMNGIIRNLYLCPHGINSIRPEIINPTNIMKLINTTLDKSANLSIETNKETIEEKKDD